MTVVACAWAPEELANSTGHFSEGTARAISHLAYLDQVLPTQGSKRNEAERCAPDWYVEYLGELYDTDPQRLVDHCTALLNRYDPDPIPIRSI